MYPSNTYTKSTLKHSEIMIKIYISRLLLSALTIVFSFGLAAQQVEPCGFDAANERLKQSDPEYAKLRDKFEQQYFRAVESGAISRNKKAGVSTIPIVFHVIHDGDAYGTGSNISDEQIQSAVDGMNIQYRNLNLDGSTFDPDGVDLEIEFCLPQRDPNGNPTNGINRVDGTLTIPNYEAQGITSPGNERNVKALSRWDNRVYYNVWVVPRIDGANPYGGGTKGYAYFPGAGADVDGTVVLFNSTGYDPDGSKGFDLFGAGDNGTMVHEIGHAFSLNHTWNGGGSNGGCAPGGPETNCMTQGDLVCDTDPHESHLGRCVNQNDPNPCNGNKPFGDPNEVRNYMNYTNCANPIYTPGQRDRMQNALRNQRPYFNDPGGTPDVCVPLFAYDAAIKNIIAPQGFFCDPSVTSTIVVSNNGQTTITSFDIEYGVNGTVANTFTFTGSLAQLEDATVDLPAITVPTGQNNFFARVKKNSINGTNADEYMPNDQKSGDFEIINGNVLKLTVNDATDADILQVIDDNGVVVAERGFQGVASPYVENLCLPDGCFRIVLNDQTYRHPLCNGNNTPPSYTLETDNGFDVASGPFLPLVCGGSNRDTSDQFCLPFDPGFIEADFSANNLLVEVGDQVVFTDLSKNNANQSATTWKWEFGDGTTSTVKNPNKTYNAAGVYTVQLVADNDIFPDTTRKTHYIRVVPKSSGCDNFNNLIIAEGETATSVSSINGKANKFPAVSNDITEFAERFYTSTKSVVREVRFNLQEFTPQSANPRLLVSIYSEKTGLPNLPIGSKFISFADLVVGQNTVDFSNDNISVQGRYFVTFSSPNLMDKAVVGMADYRIPNDGTEDFSNTVFVKRASNGTWAALPNAFNDAEPTSLDVTVNLSFKPLADIVSVNSKTCIGLQLNFDGNGSSNVQSYKWSTSGTPATGSNAMFSTSFNTPGTKQVQLVVSGGCMETDTAIFFVEVSGQPTVTIETIDDVCSGGTGQAMATADGGSGNIIYTWQTMPAQSGNKAINLTPGTYNLQYSDAGCGVSGQTVPFTIGNVTQLPDFEVETENTSCGLDNGEAVAKPVGGNGNYIYTWSSTTYPMFSSSSSGLTGLRPGDYTISVNISGCNPASTSFTIDDSQTSSGTVQDPIFVCQNESATISASSTDSISWLDDAGNRYFGTTVTIDSIQRSTNLNVTFTDRVTGCETFANTAIFMQPQPVSIARATKSLNIPYDADTTNIDNPEGNGLAYFSSAGSTGLSYFWDFGDGNTSTSKNPLHQYLEVGTYNVMLRVANEPCESFDITTVIVSVPGDTTDTTGTGTVGISNVEFENLKVYPNPTSRVLNIDGLPTDATISIKDLTGKNIGFEINDGQIYVGDKAKGLYLLEVSNKNGRATLRFAIE